MLTFGKILMSQAVLDYLDLNRASTLDFKDASTQRFGYTDEIFDHL